MKNILGIIFLSFLSGVGGAFVYEYFQADRQYAENISSQPVVAVNNRSYTALADAPDFVAASAVSTRSVVYIKTASTQYEQSFFEQLFGGSGSASQVVSSGSGVIFSADGYIITNNHVVDNATAIEVIFNKRTYKAKLIGTDLSTDLAVLKIEGKSFPAIKIATSKGVQVGEWVLAVGNPFNLTSTVTAGIVSARDRTININTSRFPIESFIQTDAAINPGNSGGALVNLRGELIGINTAILSRTGSYTGYGFAVPSDIVIKSVKDLIQFGEVQKAFLGIEVADLDEAIVEKYKLPDFNGVVVSYLDANGAAKKAGIQKGDIILRINNSVINSKSIFDEELAFLRPGDKATLTYRRGNEQKQALITATNAEGTTGITKRQTFSAEGLGADLESVSQVERDRLKITNGVRVVRLKQGLMNNLGVEEGFIITAINRQAVKSPQEVADLLTSVRGRVIIEGVDSRGQEAYYQFSTR
jgi:serine protease Do